MFESVEQLEKEVKDFQKNILASSELIKSLENLIAATKAQKEEFAATSSELISKMDSHTDALRESYEEALAKLVNENRILIKELIAKDDELLQSVNTNSKTHLANFVETLNTAQQTYIQRIEAADVSIKHCEAEINRKYQEFLIKLESTNVDQMFKLCQDIKKSMDTKLLLLSVGVGASLILIIVSIFIR